MALMKEFHTPKLFITDYYDSLIREIDIYTEEEIDKRRDEDLLKPEERNPIEIAAVNRAEDEYNDSYSSKYSYDITSGRIAVSESTRIRDYINMVREKAIAEIQKAKEHTLSSYEANRDKIKIDRENMDDEKLDVLKRQLFSDRFCFLLQIDDNPKNEKNFLYELRLIICDFYLSSFEIEFINPYENDVDTFDSLYLFDKKALLANQVKKFIYDLWRDHKYGFEVVDIEQKTLLNIPRVAYKSNSSFNVDLSSPSKLDLSAIKSLELSNENQDGYVVIDLSALDNLECLILKGLTLIKSPFQHLSKLLKLDIHFCDLSTFQLSSSLNSITSLRSLRIFDFSAGYSKKSLKIDLNQLANLEYLELYDMNISLVLKESANTLYTLKLDDCMIDKADKFFMYLDLPEMRYFHISNVNFYELKENWFSRLKRLTSLKLMGMNLRNVDFIQCDSLCNLEYLNVSGNAITTLRKGVFSKLNKLKHLNLSSNRISKLEANVFEGLWSLEDLSMMQLGDITYIEKDLFIGMSNLVELNLSYNSCLMQINEEAFIHVPKLVSLFLTGNNLLVLLKIELFSPLKNLKYLDLRGTIINQVELSRIRDSGINVSF